MYIMSGSTYFLNRFHIYKALTRENYLQCLEFETDKAVSVPDTRIGRCLEPERNGVSSGEGGEGGPGPPDKEGDKQSTPSKEGGNLEQEEEGKKSQA